MIDAAPTEDEKDLFELVAGVLAKGPDFLQILKTYTGQGAAISKVFFPFLIFHLFLIYLAEFEYLSSLFFFPLWGEHRQSQPQERRLRRKLGMQ